MFVSTKTMNLNWEILTKNLVTFKIIEVHRKSPFLGRRITKNQYIGGNCLKRRRGGWGGGVAWTVCRFKRGLDEKEWVRF